MFTSWENAIILPLFHRQYQLDSTQLGLVAFPSKKVPLQCGRVVENNLSTMGGSSLGFNHGRRDSGEI